jgi:hypothetical protein
MKLGFGFKETMRGNYYLLADPTAERAMSFTVRVKAPSLLAFAREPVGRLEGRVTLEGFADDVPLEGTLAFRLHDQRRLVYEFEFKANGGQACRFRGQKDVTALAPIESMTTLPGSLYDESSKEIGRAVVRFDVRSDLKRFLGSFRLVT